MPSGPAPAPTCALKPWRVEPAGEAPRLSEREPRERPGPRASGGGRRRRRGRRAKRASRPGRGRSARRRRGPRKPGARRERVGGVGRADGSRPRGDPRRRGAAAVATPRASRRATRRRRALGTGVAGAAEAAAPARAPARQARHHAEEERDAEREETEEEEASLPRGERELIVGRGSSTAESTGPSRAQSLQAFVLREEALDEVDRQREDDRRVLLGRDLRQRLQVAQLQRRRLAADDLGGLGELLRRLELALRVDDLRALLALGLRLLRHGALHLGRQVDLLHLDQRDLDAPGLRVLVDDLLEARVQLLALGEQLVERRLAEHAPQRRLRELRRRVEIVLDLHDRLVRVHDAEVDDRVDLHRDVVPRDDVLRRHVVDDGAQRHPDHRLERPEDEDEPGPLRLARRGGRARTSRPARTRSGR